MHVSAAVGAAEIAVARISRIAHERDIRAPQLGAEPSCERECPALDERMAIGQSGATRTIIEWRLAKLWPPRTLNARAGSERASVVRGIFVPASLGIRTSLYPVKAACLYLHEAFGIDGERAWHEKNGIVDRRVPRIETIPRIILA